MAIHDSSSNSAAPQDAAMMPRLLTFAEVRAVLGLRNDRQVRRLMHAADQLPVVYVNRKEPRVLDAALVAWIPIS